MQVIFPNPFGGGALPSAQAVQDLQRQHGFSDALAQFYLRQNGFNSQAMDAEPEAAQAFLRGGKADPPCVADLARLFALNADQAHMDLGAAMASNLFAGLCRDQVMDTLCDPDSDLVWFHARDMQQFLNDCVFRDENGNCFVRDAVNPSGELG